MYLLPRPSLACTHIALSPTMPEYGYFLYIYIVMHCFMSSYAYLTCGCSTVENNTETLTVTLPTLWLLSHCRHCSLVALAIGHVYVVLPCLCSCNCMQLCQGQGSILCLRMVWRAHTSQTNWTLGGQMCLESGAVGLLWVCRNTM